MELLSLQALFATIRTVGWVLVPLAVLGAAAFALIAERTVVIGLAARALPDQADLLGEGWSPATAGAARRSLDVTLAALPARHVLHEWLGPVARDDALEHAPLWWIETQLESRASRVEHALGRGLWLLDTIVTAAPLVGLFGTVTGMMEAFHLIGANGLVNPSGVSGGVAQALIATAIGLVIAVISLLAFNALTQRVDATLDDMQSFGSQLISLIRSERDARVGDARVGSVHRMERRAE